MRSFLFKLGLLNKQNTANAKDYTRNLSAELSFTSKNNNLDAWLLGHHALHPDLKDKNDFKETGFWYHNDRWQFLVDLTSVGTNYFTGMEYFERLENYDALTERTRRIGYKQAFAFGNYKYIPKHSAVIAQNEVMFTNAYVRNPDNTFNNSNSQLINTLGFKNTARLMVSLNHEDSQLPVYLDFSGQPYLPPSRYQFTSASAQFSSDIRQAFTYVATVKAGQFYNGSQFTLIGGLNYRLTPLGQLGVAIERYDLQFPEPYKRSLLYLIKSKAELSFTKNLIWTTFLQYNTQADNFNINSRLQWRYKPMSDLFIVYSDNYGTNDPFQAFLKKNRALVLKMNYWFNL